MKKTLIILLAIIVLVPAAQTAEAKKKVTKPSARAVYHNNLGIKFLSVNNLRLAELEFRTAIELSPDYSEAYNNLGIVAKKTGDLKNAKSYFEKALELDPSYSAARSHLSIIYLDEGNIDMALQLGKEAAKKGAMLPMTHYNLALVYLAKDKNNAKKSYAEFAEKELKTATELNPNMYEAHLNLARIYREEGKFELSAIRYRLALEDHPFDPQPWMELGEVYKAMGDNAKSENAIKKAMSLSSTSSDSGASHIELGMTLLGRKEYSSAIEELKKAVELDPENEMTHFKLGTAYLNIGEDLSIGGDNKESKKYFQNAIKPLEAAIKLNPQMTDAVYNLGLVYYRLGKTDSAENQWQKVLLIDKNHPKTLYNLGLIYRNKRDAAKADEYFCRFAAVAGPEFATERENAINYVKANGEKCQN